MKFTDLTPYQRSMLAALCAVGTGMHTDALGRATTPKLPADGAASVLLDLRKKGLVYSNQKPTGTAYALWKASEYGMAVFMSRPDEVPAPGTRSIMSDYVTSAATAQGHAIDQRSPRLRQWMIYPGGLQFQGTEEALAAQLAKCAEQVPGTTYLAYVLHSEALLPVPKAQITLL